MDTQLEVIAPPKGKRAAKLPTVVTPSAMITQAIASGAGIEVMEKLMALHERWEAMQARKAFDDAMSRLRENMPTVVKNQKVDYENKSADESGNKSRTNYRYEDLSDVTEALSPVMSTLGLSFRWRTENVQGGVKVTCILTHRDGHSEETSLVGPLDASGKKNALQAIGSAVTYLQRYTLKAAVGVAAAKDDDAIAAGQNADPAPTAKPGPVKFTGRAEKAEMALRAATTVDEIEAVWEKVKALPSDQLPDDQYHALGRLCDDLVEKARRAKPKPAGDDFPGDLSVKDPTSQFDRMEQGQAA